MGIEIERKFIPNLAHPGIRTLLANPISKKRLTQSYLAFSPNSVRIRCIDSDANEAAQYFLTISCGNHIITVCLNYIIYKVIYAFYLHIIFYRKIATKTIFGYHNKAFLTL